MVASDAQLQARSSIPKPSNPIDGRTTAQTADLSTDLRGWVPHRDRVPSLFFCHNKAGCSPLNALHRLARAATLLSALCSPFTIGVLVECERSPFSDKPLSLPSGNGLLNVNRVNREEYLKGAGVYLGAQPFQVEKSQDRTKNRPPHVRVQAIIPKRTLEQCTHKVL